MEKSRKFLHCLKSQSLLVASLVGVGLGITIGFVLKKYEASIYWYMWLGLPGELFLQALQMAIIPVIVANLILMSSKTDVSQQGKILGVVILYSFITGTISSYISIIITATIKPGLQSNVTHGNENSSTSKSEFGFHGMLSDLLRNIIPSNLVEACICTIVTKFKSIPIDGNSSTLKMDSEKVSRTNLIGLMFCSILFGVVAGKHKCKTTGFLTVVEGISVISTEILRNLIKIMPLGIFSLMITAFSNMGKLSEVFRSMGLFVACVLVSLLMIHLILHPFIYLVLIRRSPIPFFMALIKPWFMGFTVLSSLVTLPQLQQSLMQFGLQEQMVKLVVPLSLGVGACGSITFVSSACVFISQMSGNPISIGSLISLGFLSPINVTALPAVPSASILGIIVLLESMNSSVVLVPVLFATEFILDRFRTGTNVVSIGLGCCVVQKYCIKHVVTPTHDQDQEKHDSHLMTDSYQKMSDELQSFND